MGFSSGPVVERGRSRGRWTLGQRAQKAAKRETPPKSSEQKTKEMQTAEALGVDDDSRSLKLGPAERRVRMLRQVTESNESVC